MSQLRAHDAVAINTHRHTQVSRWFDTTGDGRIDTFALRKLYAVAMRHAPAVTIEIRRATVEQAELVHHDWASRSLKEVPKTHVKGSSNR